MSKCMWSTETARSSLATDEAGFLSRCASSTTSAFQREHVQSGAFGSRAFRAARESWHPVLWHLPPVGYDLSSSTSLMAES